VIFHEDPISGCWDISLLISKVIFISSKILFWFCPLNLSFKFEENLISGCWDIPILIFWGRLPSEADFNSSQILFWGIHSSVCWDIPLHVFSSQGDRIELIPFALSHASWDTSLDYPQHIITSTLKFHFFWGWPPFEGAPKMFVDDKHCFLMFSYILVTTLDAFCN
jgi:hypothetical protein